MEASPATLDGLSRLSSRPARALRVLRVLVSWRVWVVDFAPCAALVASLLVAALVSPLLGGPQTLGSLRLRGALQEGVGFSFFLVLIALLASRSLAVWRRLRGGRAPSPASAASARTLLRMVPRAGSVVLGMILLRLMMPTFVGFKRAIPVFHPYGGPDRTLAQLDRLLHFGVDPWRILQPLIGSPGMTAALDLLYLRWYVVALGTFMVLIFWLRGASRSRFLFAFAGTWIVFGLVLATVFASVGPCFVLLLNSADTTFAPLMEYLRSADQVAPLQALVLQETLWRGYVDGSTGLASGISAMPSLHVAMPALFAVTTWHRLRALSLAFWLYTLVILVGSVHLAWHYALDGYVSILLIFPIWWASGKVTGWWYDRTRAWRWGWRSPSQSQRPAVAQVALTH